MGVASRTDASSGEDDGATVDVEGSAVEVDGIVSNVPWDEETGLGSGVVTRIGVSSVGGNSSS